MQSTGTSSDVEEEMYPTDKYNYVSLLPDQDKILNCTQIQALQETENPKSYLQIERFSDNIEADSKNVPGSTYHDQTLFRVFFYQEMKYEFVKSKSKYPETIYTLVIYLIIRFNIHVPMRFSNRQTRTSIAGKLAYPKLYST
jgi:hypothetical protein